MAPRRWMGAAGWLGVATGLFVLRCVPSQANGTTEHTPSPQARAASLCGLKSAETKRLRATLRRLDAQVQQVQSVSTAAQVVHRLRALLQHRCLRGALPDAWGLHVLESASLSRAAERTGRGDSGPWVAPAALRHF